MFCYCYLIITFDVTGANAENKEICFVKNPYIYSYFLLVLPNFNQDHEYRL